MYDVAWAELTIGMKADVAKAKILEMGKAFLATPIGKITLIVAAVAGIAAVVTSATDAWQKQVEAAQEAIKVNEENIANYQNEIDSLEALQEKLQNAKGDKEALATIQEELNEAIGATPGLINGEASAYEAATQKIKDQIAATKELLETQRQELVDNNSAIFDNNGVQRSLLGADWLKADVSGKVMRELINEYYKKYNEFISRGMSEEQAKQMASMEMKAQNTGALTYEITEKEWEDYWNSQVSTAYKVFESTISSYNGFGGSEFIKQIIDDSVRRGRTLEEINSIIGEISNSPFQSLLNDYYESLSDPNADSQAVYDDLISKINELKAKYPELADTFDLYSKHIADKLDNVADAAKGATSNIQTFSDVFKSIKEGTDVLADAYSDIEDGGEISLEHLMALLDKYPDLVEYVNLENGQHNITIGILKAKFEAEKKAQLAKITASKSAVNAEIAEQKAILDTIATKKEKAKQDMAETMVSIGQFKTVGAALNAINARPGYYLRGFDWDVSDAKVAIADAEKQLKNLSAQEALIKNMSWEDITSGSGSSKTAKTEAEKYFDKQKYLLETNQITQEEYLKRINQKYQQFYNKTADYLEDYAKYSQEVYDGFKDMYKEDLEAQKEAWEEKKDAVSEYYDNLREQIEDAHDEEDYEKEQSEKRKEIFDLDMQIAELMRDGSEKAKARIAELEEERLKAEEELLDFETDKAREDELSRLEKEQEAEEKKIQDKIDGIQKKLDKLDEDTISVRNAIIAYAKEKGVTLNFAYASGTRSSVGGFGRINEKGIEMISAPDGNGNYIPMLPNSYVFSAKATEFLWKLATEHSLPQAMYNSIAKSIKTQSSTPSVNIAQPITITMGDVIIKGNADKQTVADIKKQQENTVRMVLQKIKELQK